MKNKHTILIVPPRGVPLKAFRIRLWMAIVIGIISLAGFAGFFVPVKTITNNVEEQNQKKNLTEQNKALLQKILSSLRMLQNVKTQIARLEIKQQKVVQVSGTKENDDRPVDDTVDLTKVKSRELIGYIQKIESRFSGFDSLPFDSTSANIFDTIPVLFPLVEQRYISRKFGTAFDPFSGKELYHYGTDFIAESGTPVIATASGIIKRIEKHTLWGNRITIEHCGTYSTVYAHLGSVKVSAGKRIGRGDIIGEIGLSGLTSGPHVHYEIWRSGAQVDPEEYLFPFELIAGNE